MSPTGLLIVHGIGEQSPGDTAAKFIRGFCAASPDAVVEREGDRPTLTVGDTTIRLYEVHWADVLADVYERAFDFDTFSSWCWFPALNRRADLYGSPSYSRLHVLARTLLLVPLVSLGFFAFQGAQVFLRPAQGAIDRDRRAAGGQVEAEARGDQPRSSLDDLLDRTAGDVVTYVNSSGPAVPEDSLILDCAERILARFHEAMHAACKECDEVQVLSHSLGTVVAYHGLTGYGISEKPIEGEAQEPLRKLTRVYTIGSPLEKFRFLWPKLVPTQLATRVGRSGDGWSAERDHGAGDVAFRWDNFYSRVDAVSGKLRRFDHWVPVRNRPSRLGGLLRSHVMYERSPRFLEVVTEGLTGTPSRPKHSIFHRVWYSISAAVENALAPVFLGGFVLIGLAAIALFGWAFGSGFAGALDLAPGAERAVENWSMLVTLVGVLIALIVPARLRARRMHARYWRRR